MTIVLRKGAGSAWRWPQEASAAPLFTIAWPTGSSRDGARGRRQTGLPQGAASDRRPGGRGATYQQMVDRMYQHGKALNTASTFEIDEVIDPFESRRWITTLLESAAGVPAGRPTSTPGESSPRSPPSDDAVPDVVGSRLSWRSGSRSPREVCTTAAGIARVSSTCRARDRSRRRGGDVVPSKRDRTRRMRQHEATAARPGRPPPLASDRRQLGQVGAMPAETSRPTASGLQISG
ncbi:MAG: hypothetical protein R2705_20520 [Ilumatobacteraceae bacterium]